MKRDNTILLATVAIIVIIAAYYFFKKEEYGPVEDCKQNCKNVPNISTWGLRYCNMACDTSNGTIFNF